MMGTFTDNGSNNLKNNCEKDELLKNLFEKSKIEFYDVLKDSNIRRLFDLIDKINTSENKDKKIDSFSYSQILYSIFNFYPSKLTQERYEQLWYEASTSASSKLMTHKTLILNAPCSISRTIRQIPPKKHWKHRLRVFWGIYGHQNLHSCVRV